MSSSSGAVGKFFSSAVVSWKESSMLGVDVWWKFIWYFTSKEGPAPSWSGLLPSVLVLRGLSSSELLNTKWCHTCLWLLSLWNECTGCCSAVVSSVVGLKDKFSLMEMWYIHGALLREVGIFKLPLPLL